MSLAPPLTGVDIGLDDVYFSFDECPVDAYDPALDGDDSVHAGDVGAGYAAMEDAALRARLGVPSLTLPTVATRAVAPYPGVIRLKQGGWMAGPAVQAIAVALWRAGIAPHTKGAPFRRAFGTGMRSDVMKFQERYNRRHAGRDLRVDGVVDEATFRALVPWMDARALALLVKAEAQKNPLAKPQQKFLAAAMAAYNYRARWHYTQGPARMMLTRRRVKDLATLAGISSIWEDCSSTFTWLCFFAGVADPNGRGYDGLGYTGTLAQNGRHVWLREIVKRNAIGAAYLYGGGPTYSHVSGGVSLTRAVSHGSEPGPLLVERDYRTISAVHIYKSLGY